MLERTGYLQDVVKPLQERAETVYVVPGSDAEEHVARRFPVERRDDSVHVGWDAPADFLIGYGMDDKGRYRGLPYIAAID